MINKIEKTVKKGDYLYCIVLNHPNRTEKNYVLYHRAIMENKLNRYLTEDELVHHKDENKFNNNEDNLEVLSRAEHARLHSTNGRAMVTLQCPNCLEKFDKERNKTYLAKNGKYTCCSRSCNGKFIRYIQMNGYNDYVNARLKNNLVVEYIR